MIGWGVLKRRIGMVLHWRPPSIHIFGTEPILMTCSVISLLTGTVNPNLAFDKFETQEKTFK